MKKSRYSEQQIIQVMQELVRGKSVSEVAREKRVAHYITPGSPWENGHIESLNGKIGFGLL